MIPNPKFILAAVIACLLAFWYGHHKGWWERDAEMNFGFGIMPQPLPKPSHGQSLPWLGQCSQEGWTVVAVASSPRPKQD